MEQKQNQKTISQKPKINKDKEVHFWRQYKDNGQFSNFYEQPIELKGKIWSTNEHYFQAQKFAGTEKEEKIRLLKRPLDTFRIGRQKDKKFPLREDWQKVKEIVMEECCYAKFTQNQNLKQFLLDTGDCKIVEASPKDGYWGWGQNQKGKNRLGFILEKIKDRIRKEDEEKLQNQQQQQNLK